MGQKWIIDVLEDLRAFAEANDMPQLSDQLSATVEVAQIEAMSSKEGAPFGVLTDGAGPRGVPDQSRAC